MSIVTDALNRLQSMRGRVVGPTSTDDSHPSMSNDLVPQKDQEKETSYTRFMTVAIGGFLVILVMALGAYWWGESLVLEVPMVTTAASSRAAVPPDPIVDESLDVLASDQKTSLPTQTNIELSPEEQLAVSPGIERQEVLTASLNSAENISDQNASMSLEKEPASREANGAQEIEELPTAPLGGDQKVAKRKARSSTSSGSTNQEVPRSSQASAGDQPRPGSSPLSATVSKSGEVLSVSTPNKSPQTSTSSNPPVMVSKARPSSRSRPSHRSAPSHKVGASVSKTQNRLSPEQRLVKAQLLIEQQSHAEAIEVLNPLFATPPAQWEPWFWMGTAQFGIGDLDKAEDAFMSGLVRDDTVPYLWVQRAVIAQQRGEYGKAMDALRQAELLNPDLPEVQLNLAYNFEHYGDHTLAQRHYQRYLSLTEGKATYHAVRRKVLERMLRLGHF